MDESAPGLIDRFDHATIVVQDLETACARYESLLGVPPSWRGTHPEHGTRAAVFGLGNALVELVGPQAGDERDQGLRDVLAARGEGLHAIAFGTGDAVQCREALRARGVRAATVTAGRALGFDGRERGYRSVDLSTRQTRGIAVLVVERGDFAMLACGHAPEPSAASALDHVVVRTGNSDAAVVLYRDGLDLRLALDRDLRGTRMLFFRVGGVTLEVVQDPNAEAEDRFYGLAYRVADLDAAHARLDAAGFPLSVIRDGNKPRTRVFTVRDGTCNVPTLFLRDPSRD